MSDNLQPAISYTSKDYASFRRMMLDVKRERIPEWTSESPSDFGVTLIEALSYMGDVLSFYGDRIASEAFLGTATSRRAVLDIARMLDYRPTGKTAAVVNLEFTARVGAGLVTVPAGTVVTTESYSAVSEGSEPVRFETLYELLIDTNTSTVGGVEAVEGKTVEMERIGISTGGIDQQYELFQRPVVHDSVRIFVDEGNGPVEWTHFNRLIDARSNQNAFTTEDTADDGIVIIFGDGLNGRVPGAEALIDATYRVGGGEVGNVGPGTVTEMPETVADIDSVTNVLAASGGAESESIDQIRTNAPRALTTLSRAVSLKDYANLVIQVPGIAKAKATAPAYNTVTIFVAPFGAGTTSLLKKEEIADFLQDRKLTTVSVFIDDPIYVNIDISANVHVREEFNRTSVRRAVEAAIAEMFRFDIVDFGFLVAISHVYDVINGVEGVEHATVTLLDRAGGAGAANVQLDAFEIPLLGTVSITPSGGIPGS